MVATPVPQRSGSEFVRGSSRFVRSPENIPQSVPNYRGLEIIALNEKVHEKIAEYADSFLKKGDRILDLGCGSGALCLRLFDRGFEVTGCDGMPEAFKLSGSIPFYSTDLNGTFADFFPEKFDAIVATEIIEHIENPRNFVRQCRSLLKPKGKLFLTTPNIDSLMSKAIFIRTGCFPLFSDGDYTGVGHITPVLMWVLGKALTEAGFRVTRKDSVVEWGSFAKWWRMRTFAWVLQLIAPHDGAQGQVLCVAAEAVD